MANYYAVKEGHNVGIFSTWDECETNTKGYSGAIYKKFKSNKEALEFIKKEVEVDVIKTYYAVKEGFTVGIFETWEDCQKSINGFSGAIYKKFKNYDEALKFIK